MDRIKIKEMKKIKLNELTILVNVVKQRIEVSYYADFEKINQLAELHKSAIEEFQAEHVQGKDLQNTSVTKELDGLFLAREVPFDIDLYSREELHSKLEGKPMSFDERAILEQFLITK